MSKLKPAVNSADHHRGNVNAIVTLVEYGDFQCPHCRIAHPLLWRLLKERGDGLHFVFRNFPLSEVHPLAYPAARAAEAAGNQNKYWEMHDLIFENQDSLSAVFLLSLAERLDLDLPRFKQDSKGEAAQTKIETDFESGVRSGVGGTPTFFINGSKLLTYDATYKSLIDAVQKV